MPPPIQLRLLIYFNLIASFFHCLRTKNYNQCNNAFVNQHQNVTSPRLSFLAGDAARSRVPWEGLERGAHSRSPRPCPTALLGARRQDPGHRGWDTGGEALP